MNISEIKYLKKGFQKFGEPKEFSRNTIGFFSKDSKKIVVKQFKNFDFFSRERDAYDLLKEMKKVLIPQRYFCKEGVIIYEYLNSLKHVEGTQRLREWGKVHSYCININHIKSLEDPLNIKNRLEKIISSIREFPVFFGTRAFEYADFLEEHKSKLFNPTIKTFVHNDLRGTNSLITSKGNYYIDFEFGGFGHPLQDIVPIILEQPRRKKEFLDIYKKSISFNSDCIAKEILPYLLFRTCDVLRKIVRRDIPKETKKNIKRKFIWTIDNCLQQN